MALKPLKEEVVHFFQNQGFAIVSTVTKQGRLHSSCKGIIQINRTGFVYLLDLYKQRTYANLKHNQHISITGVDEHKFRGYCLQGRAKIVDSHRLKPHILKAWEEKVTSRIATRVLKNIHGEKGHAKHPEVMLPQPEYLIVMKVAQCIDLTPPHLKA